MQRTISNENERVAHNYGADSEEPPTTVLVLSCGASKLGGWEQVVFSTLHSPLHPPAIESLNRSQSQLLGEPDTDRGLWKETAVPVTRGDWG